VKALVAANHDLNPSSTRVGEGDALLPRTRPAVRYQDRPVAAYGDWMLRNQLLTRRQRADA